MSSFFIGHKGENKNLLLEQVKKCIDSSIEWRKYYNKSEPSIFNKDYLKSKDYLKFKNSLNDNSEKLCDYLKDSVHFESLGYQSQMNGDLLVPGIVGNIAGMLYNQNNVAHQGSPKTTLLEHALMIDLIKMVGFELPSEEIYYQLNVDEQGCIEREKDLIIPFGHITSGGSLSNFEACWCSMWVKYIPLSVKNALLKQRKFINSYNLNIELVSGEFKKLIEMSSWELVNINSEQAAKLPYLIAKYCNLTLSEVYSTIKEYHPSTLGLYDFLLNNKLNPPTIITPITAHYSFQKTATALGLGVKNLIQIPVDDKGRVETSKLYEQLLVCIKNEIPVINYVSILGSTQEGSVDNIEEILSIKRNLQNYFNFNFDLHIDAAYGGYYLSTQLDNWQMQGPIDQPDLFKNHNMEFIISDSSFEQFEPDLICSSYLKKQFYNCRFADSITIDPHKTGYTPYQCASIVFKNSKYKNILSINRTYIGNSSLSMGIYSIEGSRGGSFVTSAFLNHCVCRPSKIGYGLILKKCLLISKLYIIRLLFLSSKDDLFTTFQIGFEPTKSQIKYFKNELYNEDGSFKDIEEICKNESLLQQLSEIGTDLGVVCFGFNFKLPPSPSSSSSKDINIIKTNTDYKQLITYNECIMKRFHYTNGPENELILTSTYFDSDTYGVDFVHSIIKSIGVVDNLPLNSSITVPALRGSIMNPHLYKYLDKTMSIIKDEVNSISKPLYK
ncbi:hypothetical protein DICPUDRAFT_74569 [Dictyostelium purpureum]|uniref:Tyrosine decarboxylase n=1 Tax=Dictyostelium purpureum TaxID=5786 RepID=F0Z846_DICPU|nr:uncharacterized protein DICPUDRAFT_74569 [Dictyostelium purpureum]EGC39832.1 hypothetical protein DICPUDRAFT_74569 [Dictyostelium purpureum]|eukprot:XP_003283583.1 hypothetical protein DICPUDRAFT_74569 [Dictyostelium purpureum]